MFDGGVPGIGRQQVDEDGFKEGVVWVPGQETPHVVEHFRRCTISEGRQGT